MFLNLVFYSVIHILFLQNDKVEIVANPSGERVSPAVVGYQDSDVVSIVYLLEYFNMKFFNLPYNFPLSKRICK